MIIQAVFLASALAVAGYIELAKGTGKISTEVTAYRRRPCLERGEKGGHELPKCK